MSNLIEQIIAMEEGRGGDAILLQRMREHGNSAPNYALADAIIRRLNTMGGYQWVLHTLIYGRTGSGIYGTIDDVVRAAEKQFGVKSDVREWVPCNYTDPDFPINLLPGI